MKQFIRTTVLAGAAALGLASSATAEEDYGAIEQKKLASCYTLNDKNGEMTEERIMECVRPLRTMMKEVFNGYGAQIVPKNYGLSLMDQARLGFVVAAFNGAMKDGCTDVINQTKEMKTPLHMPRTFAESMACMYAADDIHTRQKETVLYNGQPTYISGRNLGYSFDAARAGLVVMAGACATIQAYPDARVRDVSGVNRKFQVETNPAAGDTTGGRVAEYCLKSPEFKPENFKP